MRMIDLDSLISNLEKMESYNCSPMYQRGYDDCISTIKRQTIADAVEVVRCKDCKWLYDGMDDYCCRNHRGLVRICENSYCSHGERKENGRSDLQKQAQADAS